MSVSRQSGSGDATRVGAKVHVAEVADIGNVMFQCRQDVRHIIGASGVTYQHDLTKIEEEVGLMALYDLISSVSLVFHVGGVLIRSYEYVIAGHALSPQGPAAGETPVAESFPEGTVVSIRVTPKPGRIEDPLYKRFGWTPSAPLKGQREISTIGTFVSGNYGWERILVTNPDLDQGNRS
jgi:hypothetical protein